MEIQQKVEQIIKKISGEDVTATLTIPEDVTHGDYTTNVAFGLSKILKKNPFEIAQDIATQLQKEMGEEFSKIEAVKPGFINFWFSNIFLFQKATQIAENKETVGKTSALAGKKIVVEFTDPNPFKEFHIGHLYTNTVGESLARILQTNSAIVWRADYFGDVGMHVAKALWGLETMFKEDSTSMQDLAQKDLKQRIEYFGKAYAKGATAYEEDKTAAEEMKKLNKLIYIAAQRMWQKEKNLVPQIDYVKGEQLDETRLQQVYDMYVQGRKWSLAYFDSIYARVHMQFDGYYPESIAGEKGYTLVKEHIADGVFEMHDGAVVFRGEGQGLHTRVFINSLDLPTYEAKELGLAPWKYEDFKYDQSIIVTGNEIREYFKVLIAAMLKVAPELGKKTQHLPHGMVRLPEGKMSSRTGKIITGEWLLDEAHKRALEKIAEAKHNQTQIPTAEQDAVAELVGVGAIKYAFLKSAIGKDIEFNFDESVSFEGNAGPYLQYSYVRTQSILDKAPKNLSMPQNYQTNADEELLLRRLIQFDSIVQDAGKHLSPSLIAGYIYELAKEFSVFYQNNRIADASQENQVSFRVLLTQAVGNVLEKGLSLLGIEAPKHM